MKIVSVQGMGHFRTRLRVRLEVVDVCEQLVENKVLGVWPHGPVGEITRGGQ